MRRCANDARPPPPPAAATAAAPAGTPAAAATGDAPPPAGAAAAAVGVTGAAGARPPAPPPTGAAAATADDSTFLASRASHSIKSRSGALPVRLSNSVTPCTVSARRRYSCSSPCRSRMNDGSLFPNMRDGGRRHTLMAAPYCLRNSASSASKSRYRRFTLHRTRRVLNAPSAASVLSHTTSYSTCPFSCTCGFATSTSMRDMVAAVCVCVLGVIHWRL